MDGLCVLVKDSRAIAKICVMETRGLDRQDTLLTNPSSISGARTIKLVRATRTHARPGLCRMKDRRR